MYDDKARWLSYSSRPFICPVLSDVGKRYSRRVTISGKLSGAVLPEVAALLSEQPWKSCGTRLKTTCAASNEKSLTWATHFGTTAPGAEDDRVPQRSRIHPDNELAASLLVRAIGEKQMGCNLILLCCSFVLNSMLAKAIRKSVKIDDVQFSGYRRRKAALTVSEEPSQNTDATAKINPSGYFFGTNPSRDAGCRR